MEMNFNINGFARPTTRAEYSALLSETIRLMDELDSQIDAMEDCMAKASETATTA
jgi:hypothetical protein